MTPKEREAIIQKIVDESDQEPKETGKHRILVEWRAKLEREPTLLRPHQIDEIVRVVRGMMRRTP